MLSNHFLTGDVLCDPLCGSGAIPIECAVEWPSSFNICGDNFHSAPPRTLDNVTYVNNQRSAENKYGIVHLLPPLFVQFCKICIIASILLHGTKTSLIFSRFTKFSLTLFSVCGKSYSNGA